MHFALLFLRFAYLIPLPYILIFRTQRSGLLPAIMSFPRALSTSVRAMSNGIGDPGKGVGKAGGTGGCIHDAAGVFGTCQLEPMLCSSS